MKLEFLGHNPILHGGIDITLDHGEHVILEGLRIDASDSPAAIKCNGEGNLTLKGLHITKGPEPKWYVKAWRWMLSRWRDF